jgi:hypothetical protein
MKIKRTKKVDDYIIIVNVTDRTIDPSATEGKIAPFIKEETTDEELMKLINENLEYAPLEADENLVSDEEGDALQEKLSDLGEKEFLADDESIIKDYRGVKYWKKDGSRWVIDEVKKIGTTVPMGGVIESALTNEQQKEIATQKENERIAGLTLEQKMAEKEANITSVLNEARIKKENAEIAEEEFDAKLWFKTKKAEIEEKYA